MVLFSKEYVAGITKRCLKSFILVTVACIFMSFFAVGCEKDKAKPDAAVQTNVQQIDVHNSGEAVSDWYSALQYLKDGNRRYVENKAMARNTNAKDREVLKDGQKPFVVLISCYSCPPSLRILS